MHVIYIIKNCVCMAPETHMTLFFGACCLLSMCATLRPIWQFQRSTAPNGKPNLKFNKKKVLSPVPIHHPTTPNARFALGVCLIGVLTSRSSIITQRWDWDVSRRSANSNSTFDDIRHRISNTYIVSTIS